MKLQWQVIANTVDFGGGGVYPLAEFYFFSRCLAS